MKFEPEDERAYLTRRDELGKQFARWLKTQRVVGDPSDAGLLMDWKWGYGDGALDRWTVADVQEFLFGWCPRKLSATAADCAEIPASVAAFVEFLAHTGMLGPGDPPSRIRRHCEKNSAAFVRAMGNPANFGMAKSLFGAGMASEPDTSAGDQLADPDDDQPVIGPVRLPTDDERLASVRAAPMLRRARVLAGYCATPGRALTAKGNLRLADARHLVEALDTGDDPAAGGRTLQSAEELPELSWVVATAIEAGAVRKQRGKLVAVTRFTRLDDVAAHERIVTAALAIGLDGPASTFLFPILAQIQNFVSECVYAVLSELLSRGDAGAGIEELAAFVVELVTTEYPGLTGFLSFPIPARAREQLERLAALGVVEISDVDVTICTDCDLPHHSGGHARLTPAGIPLVADLVREAGIEVLIRPDPTGASAAAIVDLSGWQDEGEWAEDMAAWFAAQPDPVAATTDLVGTATAEHRDSVTVLAGLEMAVQLGGDRAVDAVRPHLGGPHDGLVLYWLIDRSAIDLATVDPLRFLSGLVDILAAGLDGAGPTEVVAAFGAGSTDQHLELLDSIWRVQHPRLPDVLDALGAHYPTKAVAKAARKALVRHRSLLASNRS